MTLIEQLERADGPAWLGYCDKPCHGPIIERSRSYMAVSYVAYWVWMRLPAWAALGKFGMAILPRAGDIAFACTCREKIDAAALRARSQGGE